MKHVMNFIGFRFVAKYTKLYLILNLLCPYNYTVFSIRKLWPQKHRKKILFVISASDYHDTNSIGHGRIVCATATHELSSGRQTYQLSCEASCHLAPHGISMAGLPVSSTFSSPANRQWRAFKLFLISLENSYVKLFILINALIRLCAA